MLLSWKASGCVKSVSVVTDKLVSIKELTLAKCASLYSMCGPEMFFIPFLLPHCKAGCS